MQEKGKENKRAPQELDKGRRNFLWGFGMAALGWAAKALADGVFFEQAKRTLERVLVYKAMIADLDTDALGREAKENWDLISSVFGPFRRVLVSPAYDNPDLQGVRHDNDWRAALPFAAAMSGDVGEAEILQREQADEVREQLRNWDKVLLGGAVSHPLARVAQGYIGRDKHLRWIGNFPQRWFLCYDFDELTEKNEVMVYHSSSTRLMGEPIWEIRDAETRRPYIPEIAFDKHGRRVLRSNWLLITRVLEGADSKPLILAGGCHGVGTAAFGLVLADRGLLRQLESAVGAHPHWQALYRITSVQYDDGDHRCFSTRDQLSLEDVQPLPANPVEVNWSARPMSNSSCSGEQIV